ncbi:hypothetical protein MF406_17105 [Georgenia sp. TF02-10]|uniref:hypothetical protein n=1 Tax=Georgenia sp. TF02-10 TaxID=2917725 RepID=UPI001FA76421|nr:hypothetical protein [Georgenia sp. TF02-10]UNX54575.1 hypothetical protein MF406_17105 [Georgenia sp. TF02-10]
MSASWSRSWRLVIAALAGIAAGAIGRGFLPPFVLDDPFWRAFWAGPPAAGVFALAGAGVAYGAARTATKTARRGAERQEWWDRAEWAMNLARSKKEIDRVIALRALIALAGEATAVEAEMVVAVTEAVVGDDDVDSSSPTAKNERRRWWS